MAHGVVFQLGRTVAAIEAKRVRLDDGSSIDAELVVVGIGVRPHIDLAHRPGRQSIAAACSSMNISKPAPPAFSRAGTSPAGPIRTVASCCASSTGSAERQGQIAARNMLGRRERYAAVPFFWSQHYDVSIDYVGHAVAWDEITEDGDVSGHDAALRFRKGGRTLALATIFRGRESLLAEAAMEQGQSP
jgi:NADPH-dependent 2,4-dienoyl-CoA reductase/sulfur reductase-like enzyme